MSTHSRCLVKSTFGTTQNSTLPGSKEKLDCANSAQAQIVLFSHEIISTFTHDQLSQLVELMGPYRTHYVVGFQTLVELSAVEVDAEL